MAVLSRSAQDSYEFIAGMGFRVEGKESQEQFGLATRQVQNLPITVDAHDAKEREAKRRQSRSCHAQRIVLIPEDVKQDKGTGVKIRTREKHG